jgi:DNA polymerase sigma
MIAHATVVPARVPIMKLLLRAPHEHIEVDMNINVVGGVYNSHLFHHYAA